MKNELLEKILDALKSEPRLMLERGRSGTADLVGTLQVSLYRVSYEFDDWGDLSGQSVQPVLVGKAVALSLKTNRTLSLKRAEWVKNLQNLSGFYAEVSSVEEAREAIARARYL